MHFWSYWYDHKVFLYYLNHGIYWEVSLCGITLTKSSQSCNQGGSQVGFTVFVVCTYCCVCVCEREREREISRFYLPDSTRERERERFLGSICLILLADTLFQISANTYSLVRSVYNSTLALPLSGLSCKMILALWNKLEDFTFFL